MRRRQPLVSEWRAVEKELVDRGDGGNATFWAPPRGKEPLRVTAGCPAKEPVCAFWDPLAGEWSSNNCTVVNATRFNVTCRCTHLTDFAGQAKSTA